LDLFKAKIVDAPTGPNDDVSLYGAYMQCKEKNVDAFILLDYDGRQSGNDGLRRLQRWTVGTYTARSFGGNMDYIFNGAYQFGDYNDPPDTTSCDIGAYMVAVEVGYTTDSESKLRFAGGIDLASGDDPDSDKYGAFNNLYYTGHKFRGAMDQFISSNSQGLMDIYGRVGFKPKPECWMGADFHLFQTAQDYVSQKDGSDTKTVGMEIDVRAKSKKLEHAVVEIGGSAFLPAEDYAGTDNDDARLWGYMSVTVNLP